MCQIEHRCVSPQSPHMTRTKRRGADKKADESCLSGNSHRFELSGNLDLRILRISGNAWWREANRPQTPEKIQGLEAPGSTEEGRDGKAADPRCINWNTVRDGIPRRLLSFTWLVSRPSLALNETDKVVIKSPVKMKLRLVDTRHTGPAGEAAMERTY